MMKRAGRVLGVSLLLAFLLGAAVFAQGEAKIMEVLDKGEAPVIFVKGIEGEVQAADALVGNTECPDVSVNPLAEEAEAMRTLILLDNSLSIPEGKREDVKSMISELVAGRKSNEKFSLAVFGEEIQVLVDFTDDYVEMKSAVDALEFVDQDTYLTDVLYDLVSSDAFGEDGDTTYRRILVISDGVDSKSLGYTAEELSDLLAGSGIPLYSLGVYNKKQSNSEELKNMFALSRQTNADYFLMDELENPMEVVAALGEDLSMVRFTVFLENEAKDGSEKAVTLRIQTDGGEVQVRADGVRMPQEILEAPAEPEEEPEEMPEPEPKTEVPETPEPEKKPGSMVLVLAVIAGVAFVTFVVFLILYFVKKKKRENVFVETEDPFRRVLDEGKTELFVESPPLPESDGNTVQIWNQGRCYVITLTDISAPARSFQKPIHDRLAIGRSAAQSDICIDYDRSVSGRHCMIEKRGNQFFLIDLQSSNGTFLNDSRVLSEVEIYSGSIIKMGRVEMRVEMG